jgi:hypothetical protein
VTQGNAAQAAIKLGVVYFLYAAQNNMAERYWLPNKCRRASKNASYDAVKCDVP